MPLATETGPEVHSCLIHMLLSLSAFDHRSKTLDSLKFSSKWTLWILLSATCRTTVCNCQKQFRSRMQFGSKSQKLKTQVGTVKRRNDAKIVRVCFEARVGSAERQHVPLLREQLLWRQTISAFSNTWVRWWPLFQAVCWCGRVTWFRHTENRSSKASQRPCPVAAVLKLIVINYRKKQGAKYSQIIIETFVIKIEFATSIFFKGMKWEKTGSRNWKKEGKEDFRVRIEQRSRVQSDEKLGITFCPWRNSNVSCFSERC